MLDGGVVIDDAQVFNDRFQEREARYNYLAPAHEDRGALGDLHRCQVHDSSRQGR